MARYDITEEIVSDSGLQFRSNEFKAFARNYGFKHTLIGPYYHQSNRMVEWLSPSKSWNDQVWPVPCPFRYPEHTSGRNRCQSCPAHDEQMNKEPTAQASKPNTSNHYWCSWKDQTTASQTIDIIQSRNDEAEAPSRGRPSADPTTSIVGDHKWREARVSRQVGVRSYDVESDKKSHTRSRKQLKKAVDAVKSIHEMEDHPVLYTDIPVNKPHPEEPKQQKEPKVSSESTTVTKLRPLTDRET